MCRTKFINGELLTDLFKIFLHRFNNDFHKVIGMMAILMSGDVYCPLSSHDPEYRQHELLQQIQNRLILVHWLTKTKVQNHLVIVDIDQYLINDKQETDNDNAVDLLTNIIITSETIAYIVFTSGSTGTPKAVSRENLSDHEYLTEE